MPKEGALSKGEGLLIYWLNISISQCMLLDFVKKEDITSLTLISKSVSRIIWGFVSNHFWFKNRTVGMEKKRAFLKLERFRYLQPKKLRVSEHSDLNEFFDVLFPTLPLTHLVFYNPSFIFTVSRPVIPLNKLPLSITYLEFGPTFNSNVDNLLPPNITNLIFGLDYNQTVDALPLQVKHIKFSFSFDQFVDHLPPKLLSLEFGSCFNRNINHLPNTLQKLILGLHFNRSIETLPPRLLKLSLVPSTVPITSLPPTLTSLTFKRSYENDMFFFEPAICPQTLTHLKLAGHFNQPIKNVLPVTLTKLTLGGLYNHPIDSLLPPNLTHLKLSGDKFNHSIDDLPLSLTHLIFKTYFHGEVSFDKPVDHLPPNLIYLKLPSSYNHPVHHLPLNLTHLLFTGRFNHPIDNSLPPNLKYLEFSSSYNHPIDSLLPQKITHLKLSTFFNHPVDHLPLALKFLELGLRFQKSIANLPPNILELTLPSSYENSFYPLLKQFTTSHPHAKVTINY